MPKDYKWIQRQAVKLSAIIVAVCLHSYFGFISIAIMFWLKPVVIHAGFHCFFKIYMYYKLPSQNLRVLMGCETFLRCMYFHLISTACLLLFVFFHGLLSWCKQVNHLNIFLVFFDSAISGQYIYNFVPKFLIKKKARIQNSPVPLKCFKTSLFQGFQLFL